MAGSIAFSAKAIIVKLAYRHGVDAVTLIMYRMLFALPLFVLLAWWAGRGKAALTRRDWLGVLGLGFSGYYLASFLDFAGLAYITASLERLILYLNPTLVLLFTWLVYRRRASRRQIVGMAVSYAGVLLVFGRERESAWHLRSLLRVEVEQQPHQQLNDDADGDRQEHLEILHPGDAPPHRAE